MGGAGDLAVRQLPVVPVLIAASTALIAVAAAVYRLPSGGTVQFALVCAVFGFVWLIVLTFQVGLAFRADPSGHVAMLVPALQLLGSACGPLVASFAIEGDDATGVPLVSGGFALAAVPTCCCRPPGSSRARAA